ncbi:MAG: RNA polymerase sigma factor [Vicinamibacterales bacterium]
MSGDERFRSLIDRYGTLIAWAVRRAAGPAARDLDDIRQDVLIGLWTQVSHGRVIDHPGAYLHRAAVRETVRAMARTRVRDTLIAGGGVDEACGATAPDPLDRREQRAALRAAIAALPIDRRRAVQGHLAGFDVRELMDLYGWTYQRARNLVARGIADLRVRLRDDYGVAGADGAGRTASTAAHARARFGPAAAHSACNAR